MPVRKPALMTQEERDAEAHARAEAHANDVLRAEVGAIYQELHLNTRAHPRECLLALRESLAVMRSDISHS